MNILHRRRNNTARGAYRSLPTQDTDTEDVSENEEVEEEVKAQVVVTGAASNKASSSAKDRSVITKPHKGRRGCYLEYVVQSFTMIGTLVSLANVSLSMKTVTDGSVPGITVYNWIIFTAASAAFDLFIFSLMLALMWRTFRTENVLANGQREIFLDEWYATYTESTGTAAIVSCLTFTFVLMYYYRFGGEEAWDLPSRYNVKDYEKPLQWVGAHYMNIAMRVVMLLRVYYRAYQFLGEPTTVVAVTSNKSQ